MFPILAGFGPDSHLFVPRLPIAGLDDERALGGVLAGADAGAIRA